MRDSKIIAWTLGDTCVSYSINNEWM